MIVTFEEKDHRYKSNPPQPWTSSTKVVEHFCNTFDDVTMAFKCNESIKSKWFGIGAGRILDIWEEENKRSTYIGSLFHAEQERKAIAAKIKQHRGKKLPVIHIPFVNGVKTALPQLLQPGCYLEHIVYNEGLSICGQSDIVLCDGEYIDVLDYKTNKELKFNGYGHQYGSPERMLSPLSFLEDCNFNHYTLQLNIYMHLALLKNPHLKRGIMEIIHVEFELDGRTEFDFPIVTMRNGLPVVKQTKRYRIPDIEDRIMKEVFYFLNNVKQ